MKKFYYKPDTKLIPTHCTSVLISKSGPFDEVGDGEFAKRGGQRLIIDDEESL